MLYNLRKGLYNFCCAKDALHCCLHALSFRKPQKHIRIHNFALLFLERLYRTGLRTLWLRDFLTINKIKYTLQWK
jgi:hypothetical protein